MQARTHFILYADTGSQTRRVALDLPRAVR
jgi:hypothetical protein